MFSDDDLKTLKDVSGIHASCADGKCIGESPMKLDKIAALLARLEAAEHLIMCIQEGLNFTRAEKAWRKAARK